MLDFLLSTLIPIAFIAIMFGMGMGLHPRHFGVLVRQPRPAIVGLLLQMVSLPVIAFLIILSFELPRDVSLGLILLAASPGGVPSNVISFIVRADVVLSIALTAVNSLLIILTMPLVVLIGTRFVLGAGDIAPLEVPVELMMRQLMMVILVPVALGMMVGHWFPGFARRSEPVVRLLSTLILLALFALLVVQEFRSVASMLQEVGLLVLGFMCSTMVLAAACGHLLQLPRPQARTILIEVGMQNAILAVFVATSVLHEPGLVLVPTAYGILAFAVIGLVLGIERAVRSRHARRLPS